MSQYPTRAWVLVSLQRKKLELELFDSGGLEPGQKVRVDKADWVIEKIIKPVGMDAPGGSVRR